MTGLKRGTVKLVPHQAEWRKTAGDTITLLQQLLGSAAVDIQHVGSTAIPRIHAKPIIDIAVAVRRLHDIFPFASVLEQHDILLRGEIIAGEILFVIGNEAMRTHHIHVVEWNGKQWNDYINFRDFLNTHPEKAMLYDACKQELAAQFPDDRNRYTAGKAETIRRLLQEAEAWKTAAASGPHTEPKE